MRRCVSPGEDRRHSRSALSTRGGAAADQRHRGGRARQLQHIPARRAMICQGLQRGCGCVGMRKTLQPRAADDLSRGIRETDMFSHVRAKIRPWLPAPVVGLWRLFRKLRYSVPRVLDGPHVLPFGKGKTDGLIYDVGLCDGDDTAFYLAKGFRVVAVEANPALVAAAKQRFE